jgi:penicillin-insensitive murein DD-endopeptidase
MTTKHNAAVFAFTVAFLAPEGVSAQTRGTVNPQRCQRWRSPTIPPHRQRNCSAVGLSSRSARYWLLLQGDGKTWQVMRLSRNRNWGHPSLVQFLEGLADTGPKVGWRGLLVGDLSQARGGLMLTGHSSHQIGLDADIWLTPMPDRELTPRERQEMSATVMVAADRKDVDPEVWTPAHTEIIKAVAKDPIVERIFVNAAIKKALCREAGNNRSWLPRCGRNWGSTGGFRPARMPMTLL